MRMSDSRRKENGLILDGTDWALFLDFDGTLVDIVERPDAVVVEPGLPDVLEQLRDRLGGALALISGRPISFLDERLAPHRFDAAGLHGIEHRLAGELFPCRPADHPALRAEIGKLHPVLSPFPGLIIEDKGCSVSIHWRLAPQLADFARERAEAMAEALGPDYRIQFGKAVAEILPAASGKGRVIEHFLGAAPFRGRRPIFVGDDLTDENGFRTVNARGGLSVRVGPGETIAQARIGTPAALREILQVWAASGTVRLDDAGIVH
jgi:trehalose 6-phosphate phosphatase